MIWRSVVGKLWLTIIGLVTLVLVVLSLFLTEQIISTYYQAELDNMRQLADKVRDTLKQSDDGDRAEYLRPVLDVAELYETYTIVLGPDGSVKPVGASPNVPDIPWQDILEQTEIDQVLQGKPQSLRTRVIVDENGESPFPLFKDEVLMVALPMKNGDQVTGAVVMYRTEGQLSENQIKKVIFYSALIGIFLTTIFAFFLSTRITQPLIQIKRAAERMAQGQFTARVPVRSHERDEIGDLSLSFNRMAAQLEESVHALSQEKEQLASILRSMADGVISINAQGDVIVTNPPADELLKEWREEEGGTELPAPLVRFFQQVLDEEKEVFGDVRVHGRTWALVMAPLYARNQVRGAVTVLRDVTEERRLDKLRKDFVANVSHELRTPLSMLQGYSEALVDGVAASPEDQKEIAEVIHDESLRMGRLVRELLDLARMEAGHIQLEISEVDVSELTRRVIRKFQTIAREQGVQLKTEIPDDAGTARWDEDKVEQVLINLTDNAIRHTPEEGQVTVSVTPNEQGVQLTVKDTGSGIPEEDLPFIFERFYKADKARTRGQSGTGLGLAIVKHIVESHQGSVSVKSTEGEGTQFLIHLPWEGTRNGSS
ncbi:MAG: ATP-binding protein [Firmicutes bacterium]|uniref:histidine kinase n=1 Tax=Melghirimyces thermohalophilus TaxID=1236220 RepID=A0A1G6LNW5_9BACL|nr:ATP-binding protein [Melghirimyces thermohalophilus]MDA8352024.1 ATP-binding protein [Bacillota bacterium]SDC44950.1 two-component system, OmpR family, sensor histidine kinase ResE [Melghirimyces thermohalophilus]